MATQITNSPDRQKALNLVLNQIEKSFGKGAIMRLGDATRMRVETISSGAMTLDIALGGGLPKGRVIEIMAQKVRVKLLSPSMLFRRSKKRVE